MNVETLSRIQFAMTISFHFVFPPMTIGLGLVLVIIQGLRVWTGKAIYVELARFWTKVFGLIFAIGVATGIPMEFQFGTNWAHYARFVGDIFGSPLAIEGIYAFFMESGFLALLLFGWNRIGPKMHFFSTCMVALGAHFSAIWILVANSWMQTPAGFHLSRQVKVIGDGAQFPMSADLGDAAYRVQEVALPVGYVVQRGDLGQVRAVIDDFYLAILNPSTMERLAHTILACWITGAFVVVGVSAWWLLRGKFAEHARVSMKIGLGVATVACVLQMVAGDLTARGVARNQPTKLAAMEGIDHTQRDAPLGLVGWAEWMRDERGRIVGVETHGLRIPGIPSVLVSGNLTDPAKGRETEVKGLRELPSDALLRARHPEASAEELAGLRANYWPNAPVLFQTYHLMIGLGMGMLGSAIWGCVGWKTGRLWKAEGRGVRIFLRVLLWTPVAAQVATQAGWFTAELGRQPWIVYEVLKTNEAASAVVRGPQVLTSMFLFFVIYVLLTILFVTILGKKIGHGPDVGGEKGVAGGALPEKFEPMSMRGGRETEG